MSRGSRSLLVEKDLTIYVEVAQPGFPEIREKLMTLAELEKSPEHVHVYRITPISLWNAAASGLDAAEILEFLRSHSSRPIPPTVRKTVEESFDRYGKFSLRTGPDGDLYLVGPSVERLEELRARKSLADHFADGATFGDAEERFGFDAPAASCVRPEARGSLKLALARFGFPVADRAGFRDGEPLDVKLSETLDSGAPFSLRGYQRRAVDAFHAGGTDLGGSGVVVLPCGAGKTIVGIGALGRIGRQTLILTTNICALRQWRRELLEKTDLREDQVGEYSGEVKEIRPVTISTYQMLTYRRSKVDEFEHFDLFSRGSWGLIIYDEVHLLPAPVFRFTAEIQATRRLGLTATLVREDGLETEVFSLIGPRRFDLPWRALESDGWIATACCQEVRVDLDVSVREEYLRADGRGKFRVASENPRKLEIVQDLVRRHAHDRILIIGQYLDQLHVIGDRIKAPIITGKTPNSERERLYDAFRRGELRVLLVSKVGNFAIDLPDANVAIQVSGTYGSRQEEAQRLGRILRPKRDASEALFYSIVTRSSREQEFAERRQRFLTEQGYRYWIRDDKEMRASGELSPRVQCS